MRFLYSILLSALAVSAQLAFQASEKLSQACPEVWNIISVELTTVFLSNNTCNADARAAIRAAFHDCFPDGSCNGSIFLAGELSRFENEGIAPIVWMLGSLADRHQVGVADMIQFAAGMSSTSRVNMNIYNTKALIQPTYCLLALAIVTCAQGPRIPILVGRTDSCTAAPLNQVPGPNITGDDALQKFQAHGFTAEDLAALIGVHTISQQTSTFPTKFGVAQDTTPDVWDNLYYNETLAGTAPFSFPSDTNLSNQTQVGPFFTTFGKSKTEWDSSFSNA